MEIVKLGIDFILHIDKHLAEIIRDYNTVTYWILFLIIFAETGFVVTPFLPGDSLLFAAGALIAAGGTGLDIHLLAIILILAAIAGNTVNYTLGNYLGHQVFKPGNRVLKLEYYNKTKAFFDKHGGKAVIFSRFMPIIRTVAPFVAGVGRMPFNRFTFFNVVGAVLWIMIFLYAGFALGNVPFFKNNISLIGLGIIVISFIPPIVAAIKARTSK